MRRPLVPILLALALAAAGCGGGDDNGGSGSSGGGGGATKDNKAGQNAPSSTSGGGGASPEDGADGRKLFAGNCGSCHTLAAAGTSGTFGPNLDDLKPSEQVVRNQIEHGGGGMPANILTGKDADTVAAYVASAAGS